MNADRAIFGAYFRSVSMCAPIERYAHFRIRGQRMLDSRESPIRAICAVKSALKLLYIFWISFESKHVLNKKGNKLSISLSYQRCEMYVSPRPDSLIVSSNSHSSIPSDFAIRISSAMSIRTRGDYSDVWVSNVTRLVACCSSAGRGSVAERYPGAVKSLGHRVCTQRRDATRTAKSEGRPSRIF